MPLDRPLPDDTREALKMLWSVTEEQLIDINRHRDSLHKIWHVAPGKPREGMLVYADGTDWNPGSGAGYYVYYAGAWHAMSSCGGGGGGITLVQDEGVALPVQSTLNFVGAGVTATNDAGGSRTTVTITGGGAGSVTSVFTRTGAVVAATGDYTAAQVTNAVSTLGSYADPAWITSLAYAKITGAPTIGSIQTPWLQNINAAGFNLTGTGSVGIGTSTVSSGKLTVEAAANRVLIVRGDPASFGLPAGLLGPILHGTDSAQSALEPITLYAATVNLMGGNVGIDTTTPGAKVSTGTSLATVKVATYDAGDGTAIGIGTQSGVLTFTASAAITSGLAHMTLGANGHLGIGIGNAQAPHRLTVIPSTTPNTPALASQQVAIGEATNNPSYRMTLGYGNFSGQPGYVGCIQTWDSGVGGPLFLNASGGGVYIGSSQDVSASLPNGCLTLYLRQTDNQLFLYIRRTDGTLRTVQLTTT